MRKEKLLKIALVSIMIITLLLMTTSVFAVDGNYTLDLTNTVNTPTTNTNTPTTNTNTPTANTNTPSYNTTVPKANPAPQRNQNPQHEEKLKEIDIDAYDSDDTNLPF